MQQAFDLSIVLPMHLPKHGWELQLLSNIQEVMNHLPEGLSVEFVIVNDGNEREDLLSIFDVVSQSFPFIIFYSYKENRGKGYALRRGVKKASAPFVITTDLDFPYLPTDIAKMYELLKAGKPIVVGKRSKQYYISTPFKRKVISKCCIALNRYVLRLPLADAQSGLKGFNKEGANLFKQTTIDRFLVDTEFLVLAHRFNLHISIISLTLKQGIKFSNMKPGTLLKELRNFYRIALMNKSSKIYKNVNDYEAQVSVAVI